MDLTTIAKMLVSFTRIDSANIMLAQTPVFMGVPNVGVTDTFDGYSLSLIHISKWRWTAIPPSSSASVSTAWARPPASQSLSLIHI